MGLQGREPWDHLREPGLSSGLWVVTVVELVLSHEGAERLMPPPSQEGTVMLTGEEPRDYSAEAGLLPLESGGGSRAWTVLPFQLSPCWFPFQHSPWC